MRSDAQLNEPHHYAAMMMDWSDRSEIQPINLSDAKDDEAKALGICRAMDWVTDNGVDCVRLHIVRDGYGLGTYDVTPHLHRR